MFFNIGPNKLDNYPVHYQHNNLHINLDQGWTKQGDVIYKGYLDDFSLETKLDEIINQSEPKYLGNFCAILLTDTSVKINTDRYRSFPIWYNKEQGITNLYNIGYTIWTDSLVELLDNNNLIENKFDAIGPIDIETLSFNDVVDRVDSLLENKFLNFYKNTKLPIKIFLSGGIDTTVLYSYLIRLKIPHTLVSCLHTDFDYFYLKNHDILEDFWGYRQIHHWLDPSVLVSGTPGDEFTVRSPVTANRILKCYDTSIPELLKTDKYKNCLHSDYYNSPKFQWIWEQTSQLPTETLEESIRQSLNQNLNDWQHWHIGRTLTFTPYRDIELFKTIAQLYNDDLFDQVMNSSVQKAIISRTDKSLLKILSPKKNSKNYLQNLTNLYS